MKKHNVIDLAAYREEHQRNKKTYGKQSESPGIPISPELKAAIETLIDRLRSQAPKDPTSSKKSK